MLHDIGKRRGDRPETVAARIESCHARIRHFLALAAEVTQREHPTVERVEAARAIARYFSIGFVQHVADEERILLPKLADTTLAAALCDEHARDDALVATLVSICEAISYEPDNTALTDELAELVSRLRPRLESHLAHEERTMLPLVVALPPADERAVFAAMEASRAERRGQRP